MCAANQPSIVVVSAAAPGTGTDGTHTHTHTYDPSVSPMLYTSSTVSARWSSARNTNLISGVVERRRDERHPPHHSSPHTVSRFGSGVRGVKQTSQPLSSCAVSPFLSCLPFTMVPFMLRETRHTVAGSEGGQWAIVKTASHHVYTCCLGW